MKTSQKDYYAVLGITRDATLAEIKSAYRKFAKKYHPDVSKASDAAERFREITEAYDTLTDPGRRSRYDRLYGTATGSKAGAGNRGKQNTTSGTKAKTGTAGNGTQAAASHLLKVLEDIWLEIRRRHPEIPAVVIIIASGTEGKQARFGHHAPGRWHVAGEQRAEIMISGEGLKRPAREVLGTLLHEAAHALAAERGIKDTSRQGRYHNIRFKHLAEELGITVAPDPRIGYSVTTVPDSTAAHYTSQLAVLGAAMTMWRRSETPTTGPTSRRTSNFIAAVCPCGRTIRAAASTFEQAPIRCEACDKYFEPKTS